jgi:hypothetical protein
MGVFADVDREVCACGFSDPRLTSLINDTAFSG